MTTTEAEDSRPTHPRTVTMAHGGHTYRLVLSPRAMRAITASHTANEDMASDCYRCHVHGEPPSELIRLLATGRHGFAAHAEGWADYADAVVAATEVEREAVRR